MRVIFALAFLAFASAASLKENSPEAAAAKKFVDICVKKVLIDGLPEANIPSHEPLRFHKNYSIELPFFKKYGHFNLNNIVMEGIPEFEPIEVTSEPEKNVNGVFLDYNIYWKSMSIKMDWEVKIYDQAIHYGVASMTMNDATFSGFWNMTNAAGLPQTLNTFEVNIETKSVDVEVTNTGKEEEYRALGPVINKFLNMPEVSAALSKGLLMKFNRDWLQKGERIDAMLNYCWPKYM